MFKNFSTLIDILQWRAFQQHNRWAYTYLIDSEAEKARITYGELDRRSRAIGATLQALGFEGKSALLIYPAGLDYIAAFFGCLYAGVVAVPAYPPHNLRGLPRQAV